MSGAEFLDDEALEAAREDRDECDRNEGDEVLLRALEDGVQPPVAAQPGKRPLNHPAYAGRNELSVPATRDGLDRDTECLAGLGQPLAPIAEIPQCRALEAAIGELTQNRNDGFGVMAVRRRDIDRQRDAVFLNGHLDLDAADLLAAIDAALKTARRRATGATVDDHGARFRGIPAGAPPAAAQPIEQPAPEAEPGPTGEQSVERVEGDIAELSDGPPLHAAKTDAPDRHHCLAQYCLAQCRSGQRRLGPRSLRPGAIPRHGCKLLQDLVHEHIDIAKRIPWARRCLGGTDGSAHTVYCVASMRLTTDCVMACRPSGRPVQSNQRLQSLQQRLE